MIHGPIWFCNTITNRFPFDWINCDGWQLSMIVGHILISLNLSSPANVHANGTAPQKGRNVSSFYRIIHNIVVVIMIMSMLLLIIIIIIFITVCCNNNLSRDDGAHSVNWKKQIGVDYLDIWRDAEGVNRAMGSATYTHTYKHTHSNHNNLQTNKKMHRHLSWPKSIRFTHVKMDRKIIVM